MLQDTGMRAETEAGINARAQDANGFVTVSASHEAIQDYGWDTIFAAAQMKLDKNESTRSGDVRVVRVTTADCAAHA